LIRKESGVLERRLIKEEKLILLRRERVSDFYKI